MVDINLFKEGEDEKEWDSSSEEREELDSEFQEGLEFGEDVSEHSPLSNEELLSDEEEAVPDFDEPEFREQAEDYEFGETREKKTSVWLWFLLGIILIGAFLYLFYVQPRQLKIGKTGLSRTEKQAVIEVPSQEVSTSIPGKVEAVADSEEVMRKGISTVFGSVPIFVDASKVVFENLSQQEQFGAILLNGNRFLVEYISETPGVAQAMGHRIKTLLGASDFKVSPEERHTTGGKVRYWGVVSGELPLTAKDVKLKKIKKFSTVDIFTDELRSLVRKHNLTARGIEKLSSSYAGRIQQTPVRVKIEGAKTQTFAFLESLKEFKGNYNLAKLFLVPADYSNFKANQVKLVLDFIISLG